MTKRKKFTSEFKREAVRLMASSEKPPSEVARELGVRRNQLYKWKEQLGKRGAKAFGGPGSRTESGDEVARLRRELEQVKKERDILKKAAAYFANELG
jgi:transposase